jgi:hypothetical protein
MNNDQIKQILKTAKTIATVGLSSDVTKDSFGVVAYLHARGYHIIPINPKADKILGKKVYRELAAVPPEHTVDVVQIFRPAEEALGIVEQAIARGAKCIWMQEGIVNEEAAAKARASGLDVVMDCCMMQMHRALIELPPLG